VSKEIISYMTMGRTSPDVIFPIPELGKSGEYNMGEMTLAIHGQGGVPLGDESDSSWIVEIHHKGELIYSTASLRTPMGRTHLEAAVIAADLLANGDGSHACAERLREWLDSFVSYDVVERVSA
jgi:hypothetical protein